MEGKTAFEDGEVLGLDRDGCLILWDAEHGRPYNCGETAEEFTRHGAEIWPHEQKRIEQAKDAKKEG